MDHNITFQENNGCVHFVIQINKKEGNVLFNDALNTFYLRLYGVGKNNIEDEYPFFLNLIF